MHLTLSLFALAALAALAVSGASAASFDASKGVQFGRAHHLARAHQDGSNARSRRSTGAKQAYCALKNATASALAAAIDATKPTSTTTSSVIPTTSTYVAPIVSVAIKVEDTPTTTKKAEYTPTTTKKAAPTTTAAAAAGGGGGVWSKTYAGGDLTFYAPGENACGTIDGPDSMIAAAAVGLWDSWPDWNGNPNNHPLCYRKVLVKWGGKSTTVTITDLCEGCTNDMSLDLSPNAFDVFASPDAGRIHDASWTFV